MFYPFHFSRINLQSRVRTELDFSAIVPSLCNNPLPPYRLTAAVPSSSSTRRCAVALLALPLLARICLALQIAGSAQSHMLVSLLHCFRCSLPSASRYRLSALLDHICLPPSSTTFCPAAGPLLPRRNQVRQPWPLVRRLLLCPAVLFRQSRQSQRRRHLLLCFVPGNQLRHNPKPVSSLAAAHGRSRRRRKAARRRGRRERRGPSSPL